MKNVGDYFIYQSNRIGTMKINQGLPGMLSKDGSLVDSDEMIQLLVSLGVESNTAKTLICLQIHGPSTSVELQKRCNLRQPDVSISISQLDRFGIIEKVSTNSRGRGRPSHIYKLSVPLKQALVPFRNNAIERMSELQIQLDRLSEISDVAN